MQTSPAPLSRPTIVLHWLVALAIIGMLAFGQIFEDYPPGPDKDVLLAWHSSLGMLVLVLGLVRLVWRLAEGLPEPVSAAAHWQDRLGKVIHLFLLVAVVLMPLSGLVTMLGHGRAVDVLGRLSIGPMAPSHTLAEAGEIVHAILSKLMIVAIGLHAVAALKHHYLDRDATLARMLGRGAACPQAAGQLKSLS